MILTVHVKPNANRTRVREWLDKETVTLEVTAAPEKGKANKAVIKLLAKELGIAPSRIELKRGASGRIKQFVVPDDKRPS